MIVGPRNSEGVVPLFELDGERFRKIGNEDFVSLEVKIYNSDMTVLQKIFEDGVLYTFTIYSENLRKNGQVGGFIIKFPDGKSHEANIFCV